MSLSRYWRDTSTLKMVKFQPDLNDPTNDPATPPSTLLPQVLCEDTFTYTNFNNNQEEIRLLQIEPRKTLDSPEDPIHCTLEVFSRDTVPSYQALSYMWGEPSPTFKIFINGHTFTVRKNLCDFLLAARRNSWISTWIWIDQVCINQENVPERSSQVQSMGTTYEDAEEVLIWLGHHGWIGDVAIEKMRNEIESTHELNEVDPDGDVHHAIMSNPYWTRMWIAQEIHLARRMCILCSNSRLSWPEVEESELWWSSPFALGHEIIGERLDPDRKADVPSTEQDDNELHGATNQGTSAAPRDYYLLVLAINGCISASCQNPRDRIYAIMGIVKPEQRFDIDYSKSTEEVFLDTLHKMLMVCPDLEPGRMLYMLLALAVKMNLLGNLETKDVEKLYVVVEGGRADCHRPLPVVMDLVYGSNELVPLDFNSSYGDSSHNYDDVQEIWVDDKIPPEQWPWRYDLQLSELRERLDLYARILEARKDWKLAEKCCEGNCMNHLLPLC